MSQFQSTQRKSGLDQQHALMESVPPIDIRVGQTNNNFEDRYLQGNPDEQPSGVDMSEV